MQTWAKAAMQELSDLAVAANAKSLQKDLQRICEQLEFEEVLFLRHESSDALIDQLCECAVSTDFVFFLNELCNAFGFDNASVLAVDPGFNFLNSKLITNFPDNWVNEYIKERYFSVDPVVAAVGKKDRFFWSELQEMPPFSRCVLSEAERFHVGPLGFTLRVNQPGCLTYALSLCSNSLENREFERRIHCFESDLEAVAKHLATMLGRTVHRSSYESITEDHLSYLREIACGADIDEIRKRDVTYGTFHAIEKDICYKLNAKSLTQAVLIADRQGLFKAPTLERPQVVPLSNHDKE